MNIVFRVDASIQIGIGHVMRCLTLAENLHSRGAKINFICRDFSGNLGKLIKHKGYQLQIIVTSCVNHQTSTDENDYQDWLGGSWEQDAKQTIELINKKKVDWLIIDHYGIDKSWQKLLRTYTKNIMVIDDLANREHDCELILDQTFGRPKADYFPYVSQKCKILVGSKYALLRPEFNYLRTKAIVKRNKIKKIKTVLISMGGMDSENMISRLLAGIEQAEWRDTPNFIIVLNSHAPHKEAVLAQVRTFSMNAQVLFDVTNMAELILMADLAIGAGGTSSWERCCLGLPTIVVQLASNQEKIISELTKNGVIFKLAGDDVVKEIVDALDIIQRNNNYTNFVFNSLKICDGLGSKLVSMNILPEYTKHGTAIIFESAMITDLDIIYNWQKDPRTRKYSHNSSTPGYDEHCNWFLNKLNDDGCYMYIIKIGDYSVGVIRLDYIQTKSNNVDSYLLSIYIAPEYYRQGLAKSSIHYASYLFETSEIHAEVFDENVASVNLFLNSGFERIENKNIYIKYPAVNINEKGLMN